MSRGSSRSRLPVSVVAAWALAAAVIVVLAVAVGVQLAGAGSGHMHNAADTLTRAGAGPAGPLLGTNLLTRWQLDAPAAAAVALAAAAYTAGLSLLRRQAPPTRWPPVRTASFFGGLFVVLFATNGSIAVYDQVLFTAHMAGHLALVMLAPVLLICGHPLTLALAVAPPARRQRLQRWATGRVVSLLTAPPVALACYTAVIVGTHLTGVMALVMRNTWAGQVEHLVYLVVGVQFFVLVVGHEPVRWRLGAPARWLLLAIAMAVDTFTGVVLLQGTSAIDMVRSEAVTVDRLADTHTGGAIMWVGGDGIMAAVMIALVIAWLRDVETDFARRDQPRGWLEQARVATFTQRITDAGVGPSGDGTGAVEADDFDEDDFDEDEAARASYNAWLARLDGER